MVSVTQIKYQETNRMPVTAIDDKAALIVIDLQKGIVNMLSIHPISMSSSAPAC
jgi:hypothetical protein